MDDITATIIESQPIAATVTEEEPIVVIFSSSGLDGEPGLPGGHAVEETFAWGDATPAILSAVEAGDTVYSITLVILEPFDGAGAALSIGITGAPELLMAAAQCDPKTAGSYSVTPGYKFSAPETLRLFITPGAGASKGNGVVIIDY